jgi:hypothetical protein
MEREKEKEKEKEKEREKEKEIVMAEVSRLGLVLEMKWATERKRRRGETRETMRETMILEERVSWSERETGKSFHIWKDPHLSTHL